MSKGHTSKASAASVTYLVHKFALHTIPSYLDEVEEQKKTSEASRNGIAGSFSTSCYVMPTEGTRDPLECLILARSGFAKVTSGFQ